MNEEMTDKQFGTVLKMKMLGMILDGCETLDEGKTKIHSLLDDDGKSDD